MRRSFLVLLGCALVVVGCSKEEPESNATPVDVAQVQQALTTTLYASDDDFENGSARWAGGALRGWVGVAGLCAETTGIRNRYMNLKFDFSSKPDLACSEINSVTFTFTQEGCTTCKNAQTMNFYRIGTADPWTESAGAGACNGGSGDTTLASGLDFQISTSISGPSYDAGNLVWNTAAFTFSTSTTTHELITDLEGVLRGTFPNLGYQMRASGSGTSPVCPCVTGSADGTTAGCGGNKKSIRTSEATDVNHRPRLFIDYTRSNALCDDSDPCTIDTCGLTGCTHTTASDGTSCSDGLYCNGAETCQSGVCTDNADPCPGPDGDGDCSETCDEGTDSCTANDTDATSCNDNNLCTTGETCLSGTCQGGTDPCAGRPGDDDNDCSETCNPATGACTANDADGLTCNDSNLCTTGETCQSGSCTGGTDPCAGRPGDDDDDCSETCNPADGTCTANDLNGLNCNDGLFCTDTDICSSGACIGIGDPCDGEDGDGDCSETCDDDADSCTGNDGDGTSCNNGDLCNTGETCLSGTCQGGSDPCASNVGDSDDDCSESCDPSTGACTASDPDSSSCDDSNLCTTGEACQSGVCTGGTDPCAGNIGDADDDCSESCDPGTGACTANDPNSSSCDDSDLCTTGEACQSGTCTGGTDPCASNVGDSDDDCSESCDPGTGACTANDPDTSNCDDGSFCNGAETCTSGVCGSSTGDPCTGADGDADCNESCDEGNDNCLGYDGEGVSCNDNQFCTATDQCTGGTCVGTGDPCTGPDGDNDCNESCDEGNDNCLGADPDASPCSDSTFCNGTETCTSGVCGSSTGDPCTGADGDADCNESCDEDADNCLGYDGDATACDDSLFCTENDSCGSGTCGGTAKVCPSTDQCNAGLCDDDGDECTTTPVVDGTGCDDSNACTTVDECQAGACTGSTLLDCDDDDPCTTDGCDPGTGCTHTAATGPSCDDGDACTTGDTCNAGACEGGAPPDCDDSEVCTTDTCDSVLGCQHANNTLPCSDGNACTTSDTCAGGVCVGGDPPTCDDGNLCTDDSCDSGSGCVFTNNTDPCDDNNACTTNDTCSSGGCVGGAPPDCDDLNECTDDSCDAVAGCVNTDNTDPCDDNNACTTNDTCSAGGCVGGAPPDCDDLNECTSDSCDIVSGCDNTPLSDGTSCTSDGNVCTFDTCQSGLCNQPVPADTVVCRAATCDDGTNPPFQIAEETCDGTSTCPGPDVADCGTALDPQPCNASGTACQGACGIDGDCPSGFFCLAATSSCEPVRAQGDPCTRTGQCDSTFSLTCVDGVCCDTPCSGACQACNLGGSVGTCTGEMGTSCSDGDACTTSDTCNAGSCEGGVAPNCDDSNGCTTDSCDPSLGCQNTPVADNTACDDGSECTVTDTCQSGVCVGTGGPDCDDGNPCTTDTCDGVLGCQNTNNTEPCDDGNPCTTGDTCGGGSCQPGTPTVCTDGNVCTDDSCDPASGCVFSNNTASCSDGNACTTNDTCSAGACVGGAPPDCDDGNDCTSDSCSTSTGCVHNNLTGTSCEDGDACTSGDTCSAGVCTSGGATDCDDGNVCTDDSCDSVLGCQHASNTASCNDGDACTINDSCSGGTCSVSDPRTCNDGNVCTDDSCNSATGCVFDPNTASCSDGNACTSGDSCSGGVCVAGSPVTCDDVNECTTDSCDPVAGCQATPVANDTPCTDDGNVCTEDTCQGGFCNTPVPAGTIQCVDPICTGSPPSAEQTLPGFCDGTNTCPAPVVQSCGSDPCNGDSTACAGACTADAQCPGGFYCNAGACETLLPPGSTCDRATMCDNSLCIDDFCCATDCGTDTSDCQACNVAGSEGSCSLLDAVACDDGDACTTGETCATGVCGGGGATDCDDSNVCTDDSCDSVSGCFHTNNTVPCDDGDACTTADVCGGGVCAGAGTLDCSDGNVCTTDSCDPASGCLYTDNTLPCDDGSVCTTGDTCAAGTCTPSGTLDCNDGNVCTDDSCEAGLGCQSTNNTAPCDDNDACTDNDVCGGGSCQPGSAIVCDDGNDCTTDSCNPATGCGSSPVVDGNACEDGDACTENDTCLSGSCQAGTAIVCDDGDDCTTDSCNPATGCTAVTAPDGTSCDNGNPCTENDTCTAGACQTGTAVVCDDAKFCTVDTCNPASGCVYTPGRVGEICRAAVAGGCDQAEVCIGLADCPADGYAASGTPCRAAMCTGGQETDAATCDGGPTCPPPVTTDCGDYACDASACYTTCADDTECIATAYCNTGACQPKSDLGGACTEGRQCLTGSCVDGVCCDTACTGQCEACNLSGTEGTCSLVTGDPVAPRAVCPGDDTGCNGTCDGTGASCVMPGASVECRAQTCTNGIATQQAFCQGTGSCPAVQTIDCSPNTCDLTGRICSNGCLVDDDCNTGFYCAAGVCTVQTDSGGACGGASECLTGHCVDGFCCESACDGQCEACGEAGSEGACVAIAGSPRGSRAACAAGTAECAGTCDGIDRATCSYPGSGIECRAAQCTDGMATLRAFCNGAGTCPAPVTVDCPDDTCDGARCGGGACAVDEDCGNAGEVCAAGVCVLLAPTGTPCGSGAECSSGNCVDGVCCSTACLGQCEACDVAGSVGTCTPVSGPPHGARQPCNTDGSLCSGSCDGITAAECSYPTAATQCRAPSCSSGVAVLEASCQGDGTCAPSQQQDCGAFGCVAGGTLCDGGCVLDTDCGAGTFCAAGVCVTTRIDGQPCGADSHCASGFCTDGVCCDQACGGICEACNETGAEGTCTPVVGLPKGGRPACPGTGVCGGRCDGTNGSLCTFPGAFTFCGEAVCADGVLLTEPLCNSAGSCRPPAQVDCEPYFCENGVQCATSCVIDADCRPGNVCENGGCTPVFATPTFDAGLDAGGGQGGFGGELDAGAGAMAGAGALGGGGSGAGPVGGAAGSPGGTGGVGGATAGTAGSIGVDAGVDTFEVPDSKDAGSCGCRVPGSATGSDAGRWIAAAALFGLLWSRRRRTVVVETRASSR